MGGGGRARDQGGKDRASDPRGSQMRGRDGRLCFPEEGRELWPLARRFGACRQSWGAVLLPSAPSRTPGRVTVATSLTWALVLTQGAGAGIGLGPFR